MKFNKKTAADEAIKNKVTQTAKKAASKVTKETVGKASMLAAHKIWTMISVAFGGVGLALLITIILLLIIFPAVILGSTLGADKKYSDSTIESNIAESWEDDAIIALNQRYAQLTATNFWNDLGNFFTTGVWGVSNETFKSEYADADDLNKDGESISSGYFSASNRMIAVINQAFIVSQDDAITNSGVFFQSPGMKKAANEAKKQMNDNGSTSFYATQKAKYPQVPDGNISSSILKITNTETNYIYQSCYIVAASSSKTMSNNSMNIGVREVLDGAFHITGIDNPQGDEQRICWTPTVTPQANYREEIEVIHNAGDPYDSNGDGIDDDFYLETETVTHYYLELVYEYTINLSSDFEDIVNKYYDIEEFIENPKSYDITQKRQIEISRQELFKLYNKSDVNLGVVGLPLPEYSYRIGHNFGCHCAVHTAPKGHEGQDLPASNGTDVFAVAGGTVSYIQTGRHHDTSATGKDSYGNCVFIVHTDGTESRYGHLEATLASEGDVVEAGDLIGKVGDTGYSFGNHLHFEMLSGGRRIDPMTTDVGALIYQYHN